MKEVTFIRRNIDKWKSTENIAENAAKLSPDKIADAYTDITADLAYSRTHFPKSRITMYLNNLAFALHNEIYCYKHEKGSRLITYWTDEVPCAMYKARKALLVSFIIFIVSVLIGVVSTLGDTNFIRVILGNDYVNKTLQNISNGAPMAVYGSHPEVPMFVLIVENNIFVAFKCFTLGIFTSIGTGLALLYNGIMIGTFLTFFYQHALLGQSMITIWLHGTLETWSVIVAGAAGIILGNGWLFPGTYSRIASFKKSALLGLKVVVGTVPMFVIAGFIESFITRHTEWPTTVKLCIIISVLIFIVYYYIYLPKKKYYGIKRR